MRLFSFLFYLSSLHFETNAVSLSDLLCVTMMHRAQSDRCRPHLTGRASDFVLQNEVFVGKQQCMYGWTPCYDHLQLAIYCAPKRLTAR
jgi:hypothetical protein